jgi:hypothetical protein
MFYSISSSHARISSDEKRLIARLAKTLQSKGWFARTGGRGIVDDTVALSLSDNSKSCETWLPFAHFRGYEYQCSQIISVDGWNEILYRKATNIALAQNTKMGNSLQKNIAVSSVPMILGRNLDTPSRFALFFNADINSTDRSLKRLCLQYNIPVFDIAIEEHRERIIRFIQKNHIQEPMRTTSLV